MRITAAVLIRFALAAAAVALSPLLGSRCQAQFAEEFTEQTDWKENALRGWLAMTGDGDVRFTQRSAGGVATLAVDARNDSRNIWYAFIQTNAATMIDTAVLNVPGTRVRVSARVRPSVAPRRVNLQLSSAGGDAYLREFDLARANEWHDIAFVTSNFRATANRPLLVQISMMDWGIGDVYSVDVDYIRAEVVAPGASAAEAGYPQQYRAPVRPATAFNHALTVSDDVMVDPAYQRLNFNAWLDGTGATVANVNSSALALLRWDLRKFTGKTVAGDGQLEFYTQGVQRLAASPKDFGEVRIVELIGGDTGWKEDSVTYASLLRGEPRTKVINSQTVIDTRVTATKKGKTAVTIPRPVLQRLINGTTSGLAILPLGAIDVQVLMRENNGGDHAAVLRLNFEK